jgi:hypothetical protein
VIDHIGLTIDEAGFAAILRGDNSEQPCCGIIGAPRINPTTAGLAIEDCYGAAIDTLIRAVIEDFADLEDDCSITNKRSRSAYDRTLVAA